MFSRDLYFRQVLEILPGVFEEFQDFFKEFFVKNLQNTIFWYFTWMALYRLNIEIKKFKQLHTYHMLFSSDHLPKVLPIPPTKKVKVWLCYVRQKYLMYQDG